MVRLTHNNNNKPPLTTTRRVIANSPPTTTRRQRRIVTQVVLGAIYGVVAFVLVFHWRWIYHRHYEASDNAVVKGDIPPLPLSLPVNPPPPPPSEFDDKDIAITNHTIVLTKRPRKPIVVAYAISLIKVRVVCQFIFV